jgi:hypothetical protein
MKSVIDCSTKRAAALTLLLILSIGGVYAKLCTVNGPTICWTVGPGTGAGGFLPCAWFPSSHIGDSCSYTVSDQPWKPWTRWQEQDGGDSYGEAAYNCVTYCPHNNHYCHHIIDPGTGAVCGCPLGTLANYWPEQSAYLTQPGCKTAD